MGQQSANASYGLMTSEFAMDLMFELNTVAAKNLVGPDMKNTLLHSFAKYTLAMFEWGEDSSLDKEEFWSDVEDIGQEYDEQGMQQVVHKEFQMKTSDGEER